MKALRECKGSTPTFVKDNRGREAFYREGSKKRMLNRRLFLAALKGEKVGVKFSQDSIKKSQTGTKEKVWGNKRKNRKLTQNKRDSALTTNRRKDAATRTDWCSSKPEGRDHQQTPDQKHRIRK